MKESLFTNISFLYYEMETSISSPPTTKINSSYWSSENPYMNISFNFYMHEIEKNNRFR